MVENGRRWSKSSDTSILDKLQSGKTYRGKFCGRLCIGIAAGRSTSVSVSGSVPPLRPTGPPCFPATRHWRRWRHWLLRFASQTSMSTPTDTDGIRRRRVVSAVVTFDRTEFATPTKLCWRRRRQRRRRYDERRRCRWGVDSLFWLSGRPQFLFRALLPVSKRNKSWLNNWSRPSSEGWLVRQCAPNLAWCIKSGFACQQLKQ